MAALAASINESSALKLGYKFSYLLRHKITPDWLVG